MQTRWLARQAGKEGVRFSLFRSTYERAHLSSLPYGSLRSDLTSCARSTWNSIRRTNYDAFYQHAPQGHFLRARCIMKHVKTFTPGALPSGRVKLPCYAKVIRVLAICITKSNDLRFQWYRILLRALVARRRERN